MSDRKVILKPGKEKPLRQRHHWIFSGAIASLPSFTDGEFLSVYSSRGELLGYGYFNKHSGIIGRMVTFDATVPYEAMEKAIDQALALRQQLFSNEPHTTAYRLINAEGDCLPGLTVDKYGDVLVVQLSTLGMDLQRDWVVNMLQTKLHPRCIYEKSTVPARKEEGLKPIQKVLSGTLPEKVEVQENGIKFIVDIPNGQKTGLFLDHRNMRQWVRTLAAGKSVLNCFSYTGGFSLYALSGGAFVDSVDISESAIVTLQTLVELNNLPKERSRGVVEDVFQFVRDNELDYDLVILDPPAFAKRQKDVIAACRGYKDLNRIAISKMPAGSLLLTCSCSAYVNATLFQQVLFQAAVEAGRAVRIVGKHHLAPDHPINLCHPEGDYLKSFLLHIS